MMQFHLLHHVDGHWLVWDYDGSASHGMLPVGSSAEEQRVTRGSHPDATMDAAMQVLGGCGLDEVSVGITCAAGIRIGAVHLCFRDNGTCSTSSTSERWLGSSPTTVMPGLHKPGYTAQAPVNEVLECIARAFPLKPWRSTGLGCDLPQHGQGVFLSTPDTSSGPPFPQGEQTAGHFAAEELEGW